MFNILNTVLRNKTKNNKTNQIPKIRQNSLLNEETILIFTEKT